jgi:hypothetical protein
MTGLLERSGGQERREHPMAGPLIGTISVLTATALWAGIGSSVRLVHPDSWTVIFWRGTFSGVTPLIVALGRSGKRLPREFCDLGHFGLTYVLASAIGTVLYILAINRTSVADVAVIYATMPFLTAAIAWCLLGESSGTPTLIASSLALCCVDGRWSFRFRSVGRSGNSRRDDVDVRHSGGDHAPTVYNFDSSHRVFSLVDCSFNQSSFRTSLFHLRQRNIVAGRFGDHLRGARGPSFRLRNAAYSIRPVRVAHNP